MKNIKDLFVTYEIALLLKELGFDEECLAYYFTLDNKKWQFVFKSEYDNIDDRINIGGKFTLLTPLYQQVESWIRDKFKLRISIMDFDDDILGVIWDYEVAEIGVEVGEDGFYAAIVSYDMSNERNFSSYEEARESAVLKTLEYIKRNKKR